MALLFGPEVQMNWKRGLFGFWLVVAGLWSLLWSVLFAICVNSSLLNGEVSLYKSCEYSFGLAAAWPVVVAIAMLARFVG